MIQQRQNIRSTKSKSVPLTSIDTSDLHGQKERDVYVKVVELKTAIHTDQTGRFGITLQSRMQYIMVKVDSNAILVEPIKNRTSDKLERAYLVLLNHIKAAGIVPKKHVLDNSQTCPTLLPLPQRC